MKHTHRAKYNTSPIWEVSNCVAKMRYLHAETIYGCPKTVFEEPYHVCYMLIAIILILTWLSSKYNMVQIKIIWFPRRNYTVFYNCGETIKNHVITLSINRNWKRFFLGNRLGLKLKLNFGFGTLIKMKRRKLQIGQNTILTFF